MNTSTGALGIFRNSYGTVNDAELRVGVAAAELQAERRGQR